MSRCLRMTPEQYAARRGRVVRGVALPGEQVESKYKNIRVGQYASKKEAAYAETLAMAARAGAITGLVEQPKFLLIPPQPGMRPTHYTADFSYLDIDGVRHVVDAKGFKTEVYRLKKKLMRWVHQIEVEEV